ncbi:MAG TPA: sugar phosphate isomerase/epimerase family protein [Planctomycetota bacterium]|nr:sugar phosphate isomerase/epimerase family protein [Planctomycetota bacterium]
MHVDRRRFFAYSAAWCVGSAALRPAVPRRRAPLFSISLAEWSLHRALRAGDVKHLGFPGVARGFGIDAVEYVNTFFPGKGADRDHWRDLKKACADEGIESLLIMCDGLGDLGDPDDARRRTAVAAHEIWLEAAAFLGCHSIRVNAASRGSFEEQQKLAADGLRALAERGDAHGLDVIVENHGGLSSNGKWLAGVIRLVDHPRCGTLPDFGNFRIGRGADGKDEWYDRYQGVEELMPFARAVSAKSHDFDAEGNETSTDYRRMLSIVVRAGYRGYVGIEYEGSRLGEREGIAATKALLERVRGELEAAAQEKKDGEEAGHERGGR